MTNINKKSLIALIIAVLAIVALTSAMALSFASESEYNQNGYGIANTSSGTDIEESTSTLTGSIIYDSSDLVSALSSGTGEHTLYSNVTLNAASLWSGTTSTIGVLDESFVLNGNGKTITLTGATSFYRTDYSPSNYAAIEKNFSTTEICKVAGGLAQINKGTIKNVNFVWSNSIDYGESLTAGDDTDAYQSTSYGMIFGINAGTIDNCTLSVDSFMRVNIRLTNQSWNSHLHTSAVGGFAGTLMGGTISNSTVTLNQGITAVQQGISWSSWGTKYAGQNKLWVGGFCGVINNGGTIYNATTKGSANIYVNSVESLSQNQNSIVAASGIVAGCNAIAADSDSTNTSNWTSMGGAGTINGVMNYWTGTARTLVGGSFGAELGPDKNTRDFTGQGVICGLAGNYTGNGSVTVKNIYYINMDVPSAVCAKNWDSFTEDGVTSTLPTGTASIKTGITYSVNTALYDIGNVTIGFDGTSDTAVPKVTYDAPSYSGDSFGTYGAWQGIVWTVKYTTPTESDRTLEIYKTVGSVDNVSNFTTWNTESKIPRNLTGDNQKFSFTFEFGTVVTYGNPKDRISSSSATNMPVDETYSNIFNAIGHEFDGSGLKVPVLQIYADAAKTQYMDIVETESIYKAYKQGAPGMLYSLSDAVDVATWEIYCPVQDTVNNIVFAAQSKAGINMVAFKESSDNMVIRQVITPKAVTVSYTNAPADFVYNSSPAAFTASASGLVSGYDATPNIEYYKLVDDEEITIVDNQAESAGTYRAKITTMSSSNYVVANPEELAIDFEITPREITVTPLPEELEATNPIFIYDGLEKLPTYSVYGNGVSEDDALIKILNVVDTNVIKVTFEPFATETTNATDENFINAGTYKMILEKESGTMSNNYIFDKTTFIIEIGRANVTITISAEETLQDGVVIKEYNSTFQKVKWTITKPENGEEAVLTESYLNKESGVAIANGANRGGDYTVTASIDRESGFNTNYNVAECSVEMTIKAKDMTIVWFPTLTEEEKEAKKIVPYISDSYDYGDVNRVGLFQNDAIKPAYAITGYKYMWKANPEDEYVEVESAFNAGYYVVSPIMNAAPNYNMLNGEFSFQITPITTTIEVTSTTKLYGDLDPDFDWAVADGYTEIYDDDEVIPNFLASTQYSKPGNYAVTLASVGGAQGGNYVISLVENTALTIEKRGVSIEFGVEGAVDNVVVYDGTIKTFTEPVLTYQNENFVDAESKMALQYVYYKLDKSVGTVIDASDIRNAGKYSVSVLLTEEAEKYFTITYGSVVNFMIDKLTVTIDTVSKEVTYGDAIGVFGWNYTDGSATFVDGDGIVVTPTCSYNLYDNCGSYDIYANIVGNVVDGVQLAENYNLEFGTVGKLTVNKRGVNVTSITLPANKTYDGTAKEVQAVYNNTVNGDTLEFIYTFNGLSQAIDKGSYSVNVDLVHNNYYIDQTTSALLVIEARKVTLAVDDVNLTYGADVPNIGWTYAIDSLQFVEADSVLVNVLTDYTKYSSVGNYAIAVETTANGNYDVVLPDNAKVVVTALNITATLALPLDTVYNGLEKVVGVTLNGVVNNDAVDVDVLYNGNASAIDAGNYVVTVVSANANYNVAVDGTDNFTISPKTIKFLTNNGEKGYGSDIIVFADGVEPYELVEGTIEDRDADNVTISVACALPIEQQVIGETTADMIYVVLGGSKASNYDAVTETMGSITIVSNSLSNIVLEEESSVYDATDKTTSINVLNVNKDDIIVMYKDSSDSNVESIVNAGTYKVVVEVKAEAQSKYNGSMTAELTYVVEKRTIDIVAVNTELTYGDAKPGTFWAYADGSLQMINSDALSITVNETYSSTSPAGVPVDVEYVAPVNDNYIFNMPQDVQITVAKKTLVLEVTLPQNAIYDKTAKIGSVNVVGIVNADDVSATLNYSDNVNAGQCTVSVDMSGSGLDNYTWDEYSDTFAIAAKQITVSNMTLPVDLVYSATAKVAGVTLNGVIDGDDAMPVLLYNGENSAINAGEYIVTAVSGNQNYEIVGNYSKMMTIVQRELTLDSFNYEVSYEYDGTAKSVEAVLNNIPAEETDSNLFVIKFAKAGDAPSIEAINAGTYVVTIEIINDNYTIAAYTEGEITIAKKTISIASVSGNETEYDGNAKTLQVVFEGVIDSEVVEYVFVDENGDAINAVDAGEYQGYIALAADGVVAANYSLTSGDLVTLTIDKASAEISEGEITVVANYNKLTINGIDADNVRYSLDNTNWQESNVFTASPKSTYTVYVKLVSDSNHNESSVVVISNIKTGGDPTVINAKLNQIGDFGFDDIATLKEIEDLLKDIAAVDLGVVSTSKLNAVRSAYQTLIDDVNTIVDEAQNAAGKAAGRQVGAAAAASMALSLGAIAMAIVKKKLLA